MEIEKVRKDFMIYIVDDEESIRQILLETLGSAGYQVKDFASADLAWSVIPNEPPHLIMSDIRMPGMSGIQLLESVRALSEDIQFIVMTSHASLETAVKAIRLGAYDYVHKPFENLGDVLTTVDRTIGNLYLKFQNEQLLEELASKNETLKDFNQRLANEKQEVELINTLMSKMIKVKDIDHVLEVFFKQCTELLGPKPMIFMRHLTSYTSLALSHGANLELTQYKNIGMNLKDVDPKGYLNYISNPQVMPELQQMTKEVFKADSFTAVPIVTEEGVAGIVVVLDIISDVSLRRVFDSFVQILRVSYMNAIMQKRIHDMAIKDPLTGMFNRRYFNDKLAEEIARSRRTLFPVSLLYMDIDHFKKFNDHSGHQMGDVLLKMVAQIFKKTSRSTDVACRIGGEEFVVILPHTDKVGAAIKAEKLRRIIESTKFPHGEKQPMGFVSISIGVSEFPTLASDAESLVKAADDALYHVKETSRNKVCLATVPPDFKPEFTPSELPPRFKVTEGS